ncbi:hypothetical protein JKG47_00910 [Acidithiobacillus sp. MC6.1]|nr:hypothetical protein [Acidithiobacillus sp. MC6.1]
MGCLAYAGMKGSGLIQKALVVRSEIVARHDAKSGGHLFGVRGRIDAVEIVIAEKDVPFFILCAEIEALAKHLGLQAVRQHGNRIVLARKRKRKIPAQESAVSSMSNVVSLSSKRKRGFALKKGGKVMAQPNKEPLL